MRGLVTSVLMVSCICGELYVEVISICFLCLIGVLGWTLGFALGVCIMGFLGVLFFDLWVLSLFYLVLFVGGVVCGCVIVFWPAVSFF